MDDELNYHRMISAYLQYVFTDIMEEKHVVAEAENQNVNGDQSNLILLDTHKMYHTGHQVNPEQK